jgi:5-methylcytosine-specific restriction protein B
MSETDNRDYLGILEFLENHNGEEYKGPNKRKSENKENKEKYEKLEKMGKETREKLNNIFVLCSGEYGFVKEKIDWLDGGNEHIRKYLWLEMKYGDYKDKPESISIFVEMLNNKPVYRVSLELKNNLKVKDDIERLEAEVAASKEYHTHLELPKKAGLVYVTGSSELGNVHELKEQRPAVIKQNVDEVIKKKEAAVIKMKEGKKKGSELELSDKEEKYKKVQICKYINISKDDYPTDDAVNAAIETDILEAVKALLPYYKYVIGYSKGEDETVNTSEIGKKEIDKNMILYGPPGTGKTYSTAKYAVSICDGDKVDLNNYPTVMEHYRKLMEDDRVAFVTFHQSYGYEEFIEGIKPVMDKNSSPASNNTSNKSGDIKYDVVDGVFKRFCKEAREGDKTKKPCVFVIDEINRGNISKIFGELITLIEDTKREGLDECIPATLPYSGKKFTVPDNVYILGTMNTADRSIALMDTALRRRFKFKEMLPDHELLEGVTVEKDGDSVDVGKMLKIINERITYLYDREHTIGHAIFMKLKKEGGNTIDNLASIFEKSVIPLLQEYFYEDYEKIRLVLGDNAKKDTATQFVIAEDVPDDTFEGDVSDDIDIPEKSYRIEYGNFTNIKAYKGISKKL